MKFTFTTIPFNTSPECDWTHWFVLFKICANISWEIYNFFLYLIHLQFSLFQISLILVWFKTAHAKSPEHPLQGQEKGGENIISHSCIHDQIIEQRKRPGRKVYSVTPQVYEELGTSKAIHGRGRTLLEFSPGQQEDAKQPIRIYLNYDAVGHSPDRDCRNIGDIVKVSIINKVNIRIYLNYELI